MKRIIIQLNEEDVVWLKNYSKESSKSISQIVRDLVSTKRKKHERSEHPKQY